MAVTEQAAKGAGPPGRPKLGQWGTLVAVCLATIMLLVDFMAVSVSLPAIAKSTGASFTQLEWVLEGFVVSIVAFLLTAGYIADILGRRPVFLTGLGAFTIGSFIAGVASAPYVLICGRVVQGTGGALMLATGAVLLTETFGLRPGPAVFALWGTLTGLAVAVSPAFGGVVTATIGWRWIFLLEVPVSLVAFIVGALSIKEPSLVLAGAAAPGPVRRGREPNGAVPKPPDWLGLFLFTTAIAVLVIGLVRTVATANLGHFTQNGVLACFACTGFLLVALVAHEAYSTAPMLDVSLFRKRTFAGSSAAAFGLCAAVLGPFMLLVLYLSYVLGQNSLGIGIRLLLLSAMTVPFLPLSGFLDRYVPMKLLICGGLATVAVGLWLMSRNFVVTSWHPLVPGLVVTGVGLELVNPRLAQAAAATVKPRLAAVASRTSSTFRHLGTATGVAAFGAVFATRLTDDINHAIASTPLATQVGGASIAQLVLNDHIYQASRLANAPSDMLAVLQRGFADGLHLVFFVAALVAAAAAVSALAIRSRDVRRREEAPGAALQGQIPEGTAEGEAGAVVQSGWQGEREPVGASQATGGDEVGAQSITEEGAGATKPGPARPSVLRPGLVPPDGSPASPLKVPTAPEPATPAPITVGRAQLAPALPPTAQPRPAPGASPGPGEGETQATTSYHRLSEFLAAYSAFQGVEREKAQRQSPQSTSEGGPARNHNGSDHPAPPTEQGGTARRRPLGDDVGAGAGPVIDLRSRHSLRGQVRATTGEPLAGATVTLVGPEGQQAGRAVAAEDGSFALVDLGEGTYTLVAAAPSYRAAASVVALHAEARASVSLLPVGSLKGTVTRRENGAPLEAGLELRNWKGNPVLKANTGGSGVFMLTDILEGDYELVASCPGYRNQTTPVTIKRGEVVRADVALTGTGYVYGAVSGPGGAWSPDVVVALADESGAVVASTSTDSSGTYRFADITEGRYSVVVASSRAAASVVEVGPGQAIAADLVLDAG